jgi:hypothetical protein
MVEEVVTPVQPVVSPVFAPTPAEPAHAEPATTA